MEASYATDTPADQGTIDLATISVCCSAEVPQTVLAQRDEDTSCAALCGGPRWRDETACLHTLPRLTGARARPSLACLLTASTNLFPTAAAGAGTPDELRPPIHLGWHGIGPSPAAALPGVSRLQSPAPRRDWKTECSVWASNEQATGGQS